MKYECPDNNAHEGVVVTNLGETTPHGAKLSCQECGRFIKFIKWLSKDEAETLQSPPPIPPVIKCPISRKPCMEVECAWWLKSGCCGVEKYLRLAVLHA